MKKHNNRSASLKNKLIFVNIVTMAVILTLLFLVTYFLVRNQMLQLGERSAELVCKDTMGFLWGVYEREQKGELTREQAQELARTYILGPKDTKTNLRDLNLAKMASNKEFYIFGCTDDPKNPNDDHALVVMQPYIEGMGVWDYKGIDADGKTLKTEGAYLYRNLMQRHNENMQNGRPGKAYIITWQNPGENMQKYIIASDYFQPWDWVVGYAGRQELVFEKNFQKYVIVFAIFTFVFLVLSGLTAVLFSRSITRPIQWIIRNLTESSEQLGSASNQLSATSQHLAEACSEQAASIEETSSILEETSSMVHQTTKNTKQAAVLAAQTKMAADKGNAEMHEMTASMFELKKSSDQISKIIKVIDEIAFQTNILALNAAVEAARAGEAGMGFAVVAEEVRNLAQRSAQAAKDTAAIIESNIELSEKGVGVAKKVGESLSEITVQAKKVNALMDEIAAASQEQTQGINQIKKAVTQMEEVTQQNAANAEESASASEELTAQAEVTKGIVHQLMVLVEGGANTNDDNHPIIKVR